MKTNLIGMILNNCGRRVFEGAIIDANGDPMSAAVSLHNMIMEYAKVFNGGTSDVVVLSREVMTSMQEPKRLRDVTEADFVEALL